VRILEEALRHTEALPATERDRRRLGLVIRLAFSLLPQGRFQEIVELLVAHREPLERLGDPAVGAPYHHLLAPAPPFLGDDERATEHAERALADAHRTGDPLQIGQVHYLLAQRGLLTGRPREGLDHGRQAAAHLERAGDRFWLATTYWAVAVNHALLG